MTSYVNAQQQTPTVKSVDAHDSRQSSIDIESPTPISKKPENVKSPKENRDATISDLPRSVVMQNLEALTELYTADVLESSLEEVAAKLVVDAQLPKVSKKDDANGRLGLSKLLQDMSSLELTEQQLAQRWGE